MAVTGKTQHGMLEEKARKSVEILIERIRKAALEKAHRVQLPGYARDAVNKIDRGSFRGKRLGLFGPPRFHPEMQAFLPVILLNDA